MFCERLNSYLERWPSTWKLYLEHHYWAGQDRCKVSIEWSSPPGIRISEKHGAPYLFISFSVLFVCGKGVARIWFRGGTHFGGGATPYFSPQTPNHKGPPLCTFGYPRISGGGGRPPPPLPHLATPLVCGACIAS